MRRQFVRTTRAIAAALLAFAMGSCGEGDIGDAPEERGRLPLQRMTVTVSDSSIDVSSATIQARPVEVTVRNETSKPWHLVFARLHEGVDVKEVEKKIRSERVLELITVAGSAEEAAKPGKTESVLLQFPQGRYIALDPEADTPLASFEVGPAAQGARQRPSPDYKITAGEFYFEMPETIASGPAIFAVVNAGEQSHEVGIMKKGGSEKEESYVLAPAPGGTLWAEFDLDPGEYTVVCYFPDAKTGKPHVKLGMRSKFTAK